MGDDHILKIYQKYNLSEKIIDALLYGYQKVPGTGFKDFEKEFIEYIEDYA